MPRVVSFDLGGMLGDQPSVAYPANLPAANATVGAGAGVRDIGKHGVLDIFYSNIEGEAIGHIYRAVDEGFDGLVMNPAAFIHAGFTLKDCIKGPACRTSRPAVVPAVPPDDAEPLVSNGVWVSVPGGRLPRVPGGFQLFRPKITPVHAQARSDKW